MADESVVRIIDGAETTVKVKKSRKRYNLKRDAFVVNAMLSSSWEELARRCSADCGEDYPVNLCYQKLPTYEENIQKHDPTFKFPEYARKAPGGKINWVALAAVAQKVKAEAEAALSEKENAKADENA